MTKKMKEAVEKWGNAQKVAPSLIVGHYIDKGQQMWGSMSKETLDECIKKVYDEEAQDEKKGVIKMITASFTETLSRGAWDLAHQEYELRCNIIKTYI